MKNFLKAERAKHDMTQAQLAEKVSVSRQTINSIEIGKFTPSTLLSMKIAAVFRVQVNSLFMLEESDWQ
jgi:putative transcriptional regulator